MVRVFWKFCDWRYCIFVSETYSVIDAWKKYVEKSLSNWAYNLSNYDFDILEDYTELKENGATTNANVRINFNIPLEHTIDFEIKVVDGTQTDVQFCRWIQDNTAITGCSLNNINGSIGEWIHIRLKIHSDGTVTCISNNATYNAPSTGFDSSKQYVQFIFTTAGNNTTVQFKNLHIYPS